MSSTSASPLRAEVAHPGYGAPYPPVSSGLSASSSGAGDRAFKQRVPDQQILEHDRRRAIEVKVMEERERMEEENERIEEARGSGGPDGKETPNALSEEEIEERCEALRAKLLKELEEEEEEREEREEHLRKEQGGGAGEERKGRDWDRRAERRRFPGGGRDLPPKERRQFKSYQVHELAEAKIEESERLRRALGIREDKETGEISSTRGQYGGRRREREAEREREKGDR
ncbi:hypothetical protein ARAM_002198 [Aspergillus rambellii]|uniref:CWF21 domain-containing protein n=1 Tax=Aspergillus rambellii TaxID=308745 RepID=A0A0F8V1W7_9EURO|nr:hypothetical protein ARAM_002198 [Aspergillus rambellii]